jgi:hypothetical protein
MWKSHLKSVCLILQLLNFKIQNIVHSHNFILPRVF